MIFDTIFTKEFTSKERETYIYLLLECVYNDHSTTVIRILMKISKKKNK